MNHLLCTLYNFCYSSQISLQVRDYIFLLYVCRKFVVVSGKLNNLPRFTALVISRAGI